MPSTGKKTSAKTHKAPMSPINPKDMRDGSLKKVSKVETGKRTMIGGKNQTQKSGKSKVSEDTPV